MTSKIDDQRGAFEKTTLDNGLRVVSCEMPHTRSVSINIFVGVGSRYESEDQAGLSHFIEHLVFKGTERRPTPREVSATIENTGGLLNAGTEQEMTVYWCKVAEPHFRESLDLLFDMLRNSLFDPKDIEKERMVVIEELGMISDYPNYKVDAWIDEMLWPGHPLGRDVGGTKESIAGVTRDMMLEHMAIHYTPSNIVVSVAGNIAHQEVVQLAADLSEGWPSGEVQSWTPASQMETGPQVRLGYRKIEQAHLSIAVPGLSLQHPDQYALDLMSVVLGEGMSSRLFVEIRERLGLAYDIHSGISHFKDCGAFVVTAGVDPKRLEDAVPTILEQVGAMRNGLPEEELETAKRLVAGRMLLRMEDTRAVSGWIGTQEILLGQIDDTDRIIEKVNGVTPEAVLKVANDVLVTEKLNMAVVGPYRARRRLEGLLSL